MPNVFAGVLLDIQGTLLDASNRAIPGAVDAVATLKRSGVRIRYVTNIDSVGAPTILRRLTSAGIAAEIDEVFSPLVALVRFLDAQPSAACHFLLPDELASELAQYAVAEGERPDFVVVGDMRDGFAYDALNAALRHLLEGARLVALNKGRYYLAPDGPVLDTGAFAAALEHGANAEAYVIGKPSTELLRLALEDMSVAPAGAVMVGDDSVADVGGGHRVGAHTVLVRTGKFTDGALEAAPVKPDLVIDSVAGLPAALEVLGSDR
ncbi:MAG: TIGR01458 family HAD-type hydrolase [Coriobacteriales bacterium]|nr:TIGR01458 family HAD-type hydrolase [Coriobacteriales bacterium]